MGYPTLREPGSVFEGKLGKPDGPTPFCQPINGTNQGMRPVHHGNTL